MARSVGLALIKKQKPGETVGKKEKGGCQDWGCKQKVTTYNTHIAMGRKEVEDNHLMGFGKFSLFNSTANIRKKVM